jgi:hypothetical protein
VPLPAGAQLRHDIVGVGVLGDQRVDVGVGGRLDRGDQVVDGVGVDRGAEAQLGLHLVALGDGHIAHVVAEAGQPGGPHRRGGGRGARPHTHPRGHPRVGHVPGHGLAGHAQPGGDVAELPVAVRGLVEVHEVHVDAGPGQRHVGLGVQVQQRLAQRGQPGDPHLGRRERVHPRDHAQAGVVGVGLQAHPADRAGVGEHRLPHHLPPDLARAVELLGDLLGLPGDLAEHILTVEVLAAGQKPQLARHGPDVHGVTSFGVASRLARWP